ncbi:MAG: hypothetical protein R2736_17100 [Solirubrobacterales bacterium]
MLARDALEGVDTLIERGRVEPVDRGAQPTVARDGDAREAASDDQGRIDGLQKRKRLRDDLAVADIGGLDAVEPLSGAIFDRVELVGSELDAARSDAGEQPL